jgi:outer membrane scaffolding protein for murein synthesis (MipA/OmpV family)
LSGTLIDPLDPPMPPVRRAAALHALACAAALAALAPPAARADESPAAPASTAGRYERDEPLPLWELGLYSIAGWQPAYPGSDQNLTSSQLLPYAIYRGSVLRVEGGGVGMRAFETPRFEWDVSASGSFGSSADKVTARHGMQSIGTLVQIGPALRVNLGDLVSDRRDPRLTRLEFPVRAVFDASNGLAHRGWTFEPRLSHTAWEGAESSLVLSASMLFGNHQLNDLFYGVAPIYATPERPAFVAKSGLVSTRFVASYRFRITDTLHLQLFGNIETVRGGANHASPLVLREQDGGVGISLTWAAWESEEKGVQ